MNLWLSIVNPTILGLQTRYACPVGMSEGEGRLLSPLLTAIKTRRRLKRGQFGGGFFVLSREKKAGSAGEGEE